MKPIAQFDSLEAFDIGGRPIHLAIGMFDGVHLGHQRVLESALQSSSEDDGLAGVLSFWPHPSYLFNPDNPVAMILNPELKCIEFARRGMAFSIQEPFDAEFASLEARSFVDYLRSRIPELKSLHTGLNWKFGKGGVGDATLLQELAANAGIDARCVEVHNLDNERVSSTRIRELLLKGEVAKANELLGYFYFSISTVIKGVQLGAQIGTPTLNMPFEGDLKPAYGVYVTLISDLLSDRKYKSVSNFGIRPTVTKDSEPKLETHLLETCPFTYGSRLRVEWLDFIRPEQKFSSVDELKNRIQEDIRIANERLERV